MLLKKLIKISSKKIGAIKINGIASDSRKVKRGNLFFALKGKNFDGNKFANIAVNLGAKVIVTSSKIKLQNKKIPIIKIKNVKKTLEKVCSIFYKQKPKNIIAVTGTNGKSSVADFFHQILSLNKIKVASIGTLGIKINKKIKKSNLTSPDIISVHKELYKLKKSRIENVIIEASSHGLKQGRLNEIDFKSGVFTNFSQDHLDYHKNMKNYLNAKLILFSHLLKKKRNIVLDENIKEFNILKKIAINKNLKISSINKTMVKNFNPNNKLIGIFQKKNLLMAMSIAHLSGLSKNIINKSLKKIKNVNGRLELIRTLPNKSKIFIDYAHSPDALCSVLQSLKDFYNKDISIVFGCGGERDVKKRPLMAKIVRNFCKKIYVTDDNPRNENPKKIRAAIIRNLKKGSFLEISDRLKAIQTAIKNSQPNEIILIAGKGHETFQDYGNKIINISDKNIINKTILKKKLFNKSMFDNQWNSEIINQVINKKSKINFKGVSIDSKNIKKNNLFIAIKGKNNNGHKYMHEAYKKGASFSVISEKKYQNNKKKIIKVKNTKLFLNKLAITKRNVTHAKIIAVTGSSGKTTLKTLLGNLLNCFENTYFSPKSYNNHYGVPLSLCNLEANHKYGVFEIGMSKAGEIDKLSKLVKPDLAIITNIAEAHIENFKNIKDIAKAKSEIIQNVKKNGTVLINRDDNFFHFLQKKAREKKLKVLSFGFSKKADIFPISIKKKANKILMKINVMNEICHITNKNINYYNVLSAIAVLKYFNLDLKKIRSSKFFLKAISGRGSIHTIKRYNKEFKLIDESYNANPLSVKNAIFNLSNIKKNNSKKYLLLGDMLELGNKSDYYHKNLSKVINNTDIDKVFVYGDKILNTFKYTKKNKQGNILQHHSDFDFIFSDLIKNNDYLMIKASNATGLNKLSNKIIRGIRNVI